MTRLIRREARSPFGGWLLDEDFDRAFQGFFRPVRWPEEAEAQSLVPALDIVERKDEYVVRTEMPGVAKENIEVTLEDGILTIAGESRGESEEKEEGRVLRKERHYGKYVRSLRLGAHVDGRNIKASYRDGVLELVLPKAEEVKPKKIAVDVK
jgi:HSP20 family protein